MAEYSKPYILAYRGAALAEVDSIDVTFTSNDKPVKTLLKGLAGFSDGAEEVSMNFSSAVPIEGFEVDFAALCMAHRTIDLAVKEARAITTLQGRLMTVGSKSGVDNPNGVSMTFSGKMLSRIIV